MKNWKMIGLAILLAAMIPVSAAASAAGDAGSIPAVLSSANSANSAESDSSEAAGGQEAVFTVEPAELSVPGETEPDAPQTDDGMVRLSLLCAVSALGICVTGKKKVG